MSQDKCQSTQEISRYKVHAKNGETEVVEAEHALDAIREAGAESAYRATPMEKDK